MFFFGFGGSKGVTSQILLFAICLIGVILMTVFPETVGQVRQPRTMNFWGIIRGLVKSLAGYTPRDLT